MFLVWINQLSLTDKKLLIMLTNPRIAVITKAPINKFRQKSPFYRNFVSHISFFEQMTIENRKIGEQFQSIAKNVFPRIELFQLDEIFDFYAKKNKKLEEFDLIVTVGGDGTFLSCSHFLSDKTRPIFGINSSPNKSAGFLLELPYHVESFGQQVKDLMVRLKEGNYSLLHRKRFEALFSEPKNGISSINNEHENYVIGLNDLFFGSLSQATTARYDFSADNKPTKSIKSTGCLVYTGSGSSAWAFSMNHVSERKIKLMLECLNLPTDKKKILELQTWLKEKQRFNPQFNKLAFSHRESTSVDPEVKEEGFCNKVVIENKTIGAFVAIDGFEHILELDEKVEVRLCGQEKDLLCVGFN